MKQTGWTTNEKISYEGVTTDAPPPLEPGLYRARITEAKPQPTKEKKPMIKLTVEVFENDKGEALALKRKLTDNMVLTQAAAFRILILSKALGISPLEENSPDAAAAFCKEIVTAAKGGVWVRVKADEYTSNGETKPTSRVDRYLSDEEVKEAAAKAAGGDDAPANGAPVRRPRGKVEGAAAAS